MILEIEGRSLSVTNKDNKCYDKRENNNRSDFKEILNKLKDKIKCSLNNYRERRIKLAKYANQLEKSNKILNKLLLMQSKQ